MAGNIPAHFTIMCMALFRGQLNRRILTRPRIDNPTRALYRSRRVHGVRCLDFLLNHDQSLAPLGTDLSLLFGTVR